jgi:uncharacterized membrane protein
MMSPKSSSSTVTAASAGQWVRAFVAICTAVLLASSCVQTWLTSRVLTSNFISPASWMSLVGVQVGPGGAPDEAPIEFTSIAATAAAMIVSTWILGSIFLARRTGRSIASALVCWGLWGSLWWCLLDLWEWAWIGGGLIGWQGLVTFLTVTPQFWLAFCVSGWLTTLCCLSIKPAQSTLNVTSESSPRTSTRWLWLACGLYIVIFTTMNWRLYFNLLIPHGDSAMYEEHLWNVLHGKGFRSYLDQGLFWGEHIQFVHLFLIPLYVLWPSHLLLELAESTALALGAFPVYWMTRRQSGSDKLALAASIAYLLYAPMQFLDIEIDLKTFRPEAFGIPLLLLTLDQLERRNLRGLLLGMCMTFTVKEDYALIFGPLGLWIFTRDLWQRRSQTVIQASKVRWWLVGISMSVGSVAYLWVATRVVMPWFRSGAEVHYARYFEKFGKTPEQIVQTMVTQPGLLFGELISTSTVLYALAMLAPVAFLAFFSPGRLAVGGPLFGILCLNELAKDPRHQFHAPLVAIVFWAVTAGIPNAIECSKIIVARLSEVTLSPALLSTLIRSLLVTTALATNFFFSLGPLGISFWDPGSSWFWRTLYAPSRRAALFAGVPPKIPISSRVASTDFVHPRFTHYDRSYDYSGYRRKVSNYEEHVPEDTDFIVIDTQHRYSEIKNPSEIPEYRDHPEQWELLPDQTEGYFIILMRKR